MIIMIIGVRFFVDSFLYLVEVDAYLTVFVVEGNQHFIVVNINAVEEYIYQSFLLLVVIKVCLVELADPELYLLPAQHGTLDTLFRNTDTKRFFFLNSMKRD